MLFNSLQYAIFLPIVFIIYWAIPHKYRWVILFIASYYFYMSWNPKYVVLILGTTIISYFAGILIEKSEAKSTKKMILIIALVICLGVLFIFKYFNFAIETFCNLIKFAGIELQPITLKLLLPVGISFYTFQTLAYVVDVYRGDIKAERHFGYYATFIAFFPQLVAGPIERTSNLLPQIKDEKKFNEENAIIGIENIIEGLFKKIVIADTLSEYVDAVYNMPSSHCGFDMLLAILFFTFQIYCDFSGYSSIAIGSAKLFNINLMENFKSPYFSVSIREFWKRWHISLSTWFKDYVYIPLGGSRCNSIKNSLNLLITFLVSGIWHGANFTFIIWGAVHGIAQILEKMLIHNKKSNKLINVVKWCIVFGFCNFAWVIFRANNVSEAFYIILHCFDGVLNPVQFLHTNLGISKLRFIYIIFLLLVLTIIDYINYNAMVKKKIIDKPIIS